MRLGTFLLSACLLAAARVEAANILGVFTMFSPSHNIIHLSVLKTLADAGHNVTIVSLLPLKDKNPNYRLLLTEMDEAESKMLSENMRALTKTKSMIQMIRMTVGFLTVSQRIQEKMLLHPLMQELLNNKANHFDLMILGYAFNSQFLGVADHFKCPVILDWVNIPMPGTNGLIGNPDGIAYIPVPWVGSKPMGFFKRVANFLIVALIKPLMFYFESSNYDNHKKMFPPELGYRSLAEMKKNISLMFCSTTISEEPTRAYVPGLILVGGIQVKEKPDPLAPDVESFINSAEHGVIFFSLGSNVKSDDFPSTQIVYNALANRKEKVLWKWDTSEVPGNASNIMFKKWFAQDDILAHPKVKLFITHGGKGSITEAQYHGVPMLAMPVFGDQFTNANSMQDQHYGLVFNYKTGTEEDFNTQLQEVLHNSTYSNAIKHYSNLYRDRPITARQSVLYWSEYVMRHHGAKHIQSPLLYLNFIQEQSLDILAFMVVVLVGFFYLITLPFRFVTQLFQSTRNPKKKRD